MNLQLNETYNGFKLLERNEISEINSISNIFVHIKTGAKLLYLENDEDNKVFSITFRTPPKDDTGITHILEHSVLCGSDKFPVKEPFVELAKGSLNTFLNAMTFSDKTMYPIASKNHKDFKNLMNVYLDAVFFPNIYKTPEILMQEGWHYELDDKNKDIIYKGVVYNEMKGAFSSPESLLMSKIQESLYKDSPYSFESGGNPDFIPNLTYKDFIAYHKKYYHPSNSFLFLYGDVNILESLDFINKEYLDKFDKEIIDSTINCQTPYISKDTQLSYYPISKNEKEENKTYLSLNYVLGKSTDSQLYLAFDILEYMLLETPASPLKKAIIRSGIGKDVFGIYNNDILQPNFSIVVKNANEEDLPKLKNIVEKCLNDILANGLDKKLIQSSINKKEFILREADVRSYPKGLMYNIKAMSSWLYNESPNINLAFEKQLEKIKNLSENGYFENIIDKYLINSKHSSVVVIKPEKGLNEKYSKQVEENLKIYKNSLNDEELNSLVKTTKNLIQFQQKQDSKENIEKLPLLSISDINKDVEKIDSLEAAYEKCKIIYTEEFTSGIVYINSYFDTTSVPYELIPYITLLSNILGKLDTKNYNYENLSNEINTNIGGMYFSSVAYSHVTLSNEFYPKLVVKSKVLSDKIPDLMQLLGEILSSTKFNNKSRLKELISEIKSQEEMGIFDQGHLIAITRALSYFSSSSKYNEIINGLSYYKFLCHLDDNYDELHATIVSNLESVLKLIFNQNNILLSVTCENHDYSKVINSLPVYYKKLDSNDVKHIKYDIKLENKKEGLLSPSKVQYVAIGGSFIEKDYKYSGKMQVLKTILSLDYLWNNVRVLGGAYGAFSVFKRNGCIALGSYRDPNLLKTLDTFKNCYKFLENFNVSNREMTKYIIGTISNKDQPLTASMKGEKATNNYITGLTFDMEQNERYEILTTNQNDIKMFTSLLSEVFQKDCYCVLGNEDLLKNNKKSFLELIDVFN
ncbi:MAG: insulinase family protein [Clostridiaceae bacterium]